MTDLLVSAGRIGVERRSGPSAIVAIPAFAAGGALCGVAARAWMRLISSDPEFTWAGSIGIVVLFTVVGTAQGCALAVRRRRWRRWAQAPVRVLAVLTGLLLGASAG